MPDLHPPARRGLIVLLVLGLGLGWGANWPIMKITFTEIPVWTFRAWSSLLAGAIVLGLARLAGGRLWPEPAEWRPVMLAALCNVTAWHILTGYGVKLVASGHAAVLAYTMPLWVAVLSTGVLRQPLPMASLVGLVLGLAGVGVLVAPDLGSLGDAPAGAALVILGALFWAIGILIQKTSSIGLSTLALTGWQLVLGCLPIFVVMPLVEGLQMPEASPAAWAAAVYLTFVGLVVCYVIWFKIVSLLPAHMASIAALLVPACGVISGALFLGEPFGAREVLALAFIASAVIMVLAPPASLRPSA